jgi:hypothetical protein
MPANLLLLTEYYNLRKKVPEKVSIIITKRIFYHVTLEQSIQNSHSFDKGVMNRSNCLSLVSML